MKLHVKTANLETEIELQIAAPRISAQIGEHVYEIELLQTARGRFVLSSAGKVFDCRVEGRPESGHAVEVFVGGRSHRITLTDPKRLRGGAVAGGHADEAARIMAPMPGKVVRVLVSVGDQIDVGAGVAVVEAMKMQNELKSPKQGTVTAINVQVGATVNGGDVLAVIE
jgi:biotin carboxyl carrier protein